MLIEHPRPPKRASLLLALLLLSVASAAAGCDWISGNTMSPEEYERRRLESERKAKEEASAGYDRIGQIVHAWKDDSMVHPDIEKAEGATIKCDDEAIKKSIKDPDGAVVTMLYWDYGKRLLDEETPDTFKDLDLKTLRQRNTDSDLWVPTKSELDGGNAFRWEKAHAQLEKRPYIAVVRVHEYSSASTFLQEGNRFSPGRIKGSLSIFDWRSGELRCGAVVEATSSESVRGTEASLKSDVLDNFNKALATTLGEISTTLTFSDDINEKPRF